MLNSKENEFEVKQVKKRPSGQENEPCIFAMGVVQEPTRGTYRTEGNGEATHDVRQNDYMIIKLQGAKGKSEVGKEVGD